MALGAGGGETRDADSMASSRIQAFLEMEVSPRTSADPARATATDPADGEGEPAVGSGARIANELWVKLGLRVSPRTVRKYLLRAPAGCPRGDQRWSTFLKNHAQAIVACDFFVAVTCGLRLLYVFVVMEHRSRRLIHCNVTAHPSALWTRQQLREALGYETRYRYLIHDRDNIFSLEWTAPLAT
jgi:hypothetical protein